MMMVKSQSTTSGDSSSSRSSGSTTTTTTTTWGTPPSSRTALCRHYDDDDVDVDDDDDDFDGSSESSIDFDRRHRHRQEHQFAYHRRREQNGSSRRRRRRRYPLLKSSPVPLPLLLVDLCIATMTALLMILLGGTTVVVVEVAAQSSNYNPQNPEVPTNKYYVGYPTFDQQQLTVELTYPVSNFIPYENLRYRVYDNEECGKGQTSENPDANDVGDVTFDEFLQIDISPDVIDGGNGNGNGNGDDGEEDEIQQQPMGDGDAYRDYKVSLTFDPEAVRFSSVFQVVNPTTLGSTVSFCVKVSAMSAEGINPVAVSLFERETFVTLEFLQTGEFSDEYIVSTDDSAVAVTEGKDYFLMGYFCDEDNNEIVGDNIQPIFSGMPIRLCVTPDEVARQANVFMRLIETFAWTRESIFQSAIDYLQVPANKFTTVDCQPGMLVCSITTYLKPQFFYRNGNVTGSGVGWLQFGTGPCPESRRARILMKSNPQQYSSRSMSNQEAALSYSMSSLNETAGAIEGATPSRSRATTSTTLVDVDNDDSASRSATISAGDDDDDDDDTGSNIFDHMTRQFDTLQAEGDDGVEVDVSSSTCAGQGSAQWAGDGVFIVEHPLTRLYRADAFLCDEDNNRLIPEQNPLGVGSIARVCVKPEQLAIRENVVIRSIDTFTWTEDASDRTPLNQTAITPNQQAEATTQIYCERGSLVCAFETVLDVSFYDNQGFIDGRGVVWFEFGAAATSRNLQIPPEFDLGSQVLPAMEPGFAGATPFEVSAVIVPPKELQQSFFCTAYECDEKLQKIIPQQQEKTNGAYVRMCVEPMDYARVNGAKIWMIESWTWWRQNFTQPAVISQGIEAPDGRTLLSCYRGDPVCTFVTRLRDEFFNMTGAMFSDGYCWLTYGSGDRGFSAPIVVEGQSEGTDSDEEAEVVLIDPEADGLYAGGNAINYEFPVTGNWKPPEIECPPEDHDLGVWWDQLDDMQRWMIIASLVSVMSSICCIFCCCLMSGYRSKRRQITETKGDNKIVVNVGVSDSNTTENTQANTVNEVGERSADPDNEINRTLEMKQTLENGVPEKEDVCFGDDQYSGTRDCHKCVNSYMKKNPDQTYSPTAYREIINELLRRKERAFCTRSAAGGEWRICNKHEVISLLGEVWRDNKRQEGQIRPSSGRQMSSQSHNRQSSSRSMKIR
mmetsp:Transcript_48693/g.117785  ORF Transcript_48693/g.117785 Transcript_48693/m.117785 type:complete len:1177 (-) Transcript_48693:145-3675(-)